MTRIMAGNYLPIQRGSIVGMTREQEEDLRRKQQLLEARESQQQAAIQEAARQIQMQQQVAAQRQAQSALEAQLAERAAQSQYGRDLGMLGARSAYDMQAANANRAHDAGMTRLRDRLLSGQNSAAFNRDLQRMGVQQGYGQENMMLQNQLGQGDMRLRQQLGQQDMMLQNTLGQDDMLLRHQLGEQVAGTAFGRTQQLQQLQHQLGMDRLGNEQAHDLSRMQLGSDLDMARDQLRGDLDMRNQSSYLQQQYGLMGQNNQQRFDQQQQLVEQEFVSRQAQQFDANFAKLSQMAGDFDPATAAKFQRIQSRYADLNASQDQLRPMEVMRMKANLLGELQQMGTPGFNQQEKVIGQGTPNEQRMFRREDGSWTEPMPSGAAIQPRPMMLGDELQGWLVPRNAGQVILRQPQKQSTGPDLRAQDMEHANDWIEKRMMEPVEMDDPLNPGEVKTRARTAQEAIREWQEIQKAKLGVHDPMAYRAMNQNVVPSPRASGVEMLMGNPLSPGRNTGVGNRAVGASGAINSNTGSNNTAGRQPQMSVRPEVAERLKSAGYSAEDYLFAVRIANDPERLKQENDRTKAYVRSILEAAGFGR